MRQDHPILRIAVIGGTGKLGQGLVARWALAGQHIIIGSRQLKKAQRTAADLNKQLGNSKIEGLANRGAAAVGDVIILCVPYAAQRDILADIRDVCQGKVLINVGVALNPNDPTRIQRPPAGSASAEARAFLGDGVKVVAAFQNVSAAKLRNPQATVDCDVLVCGDDPQAKQVVMHLVELAGMRPLDAGPLVNAVGVEILTAILIGINLSHKVKGAGIRVTGLSTKPPHITLTAIPGIPLIQPGDDLASIIVNCAAAAGIEFCDGDVLVVTQKVISKAEGRAVRLDEVEPSERAWALAAQTRKDPHLVEVILREARAVLRWRPGLIIAEHRLGWVCTNAGVDRSNIAPPGQDVVLPLPEDPDRSARQLRDRVRQVTGTDVAVVITDTHGRPFRLGAVGVAVGVAGLPPLTDLRGRLDLYGYELRTTTVAVADELASAASLLMGQADEGRPVVLVRGASYVRRPGKARDLQRPRELDLFR